MFRTNMCPSSGEITVSMGHLVLVTLYGWLVYRVHPAYQSDKYQVSNRCSYFSWWWAHSRPKHVEKRNKHTKKNCAPSWLYLQVSGLFRDVWLPICSLGRWTSVLADFWDSFFIGRCRYGTLTPAVADPSSLFDSFTLSNLSIWLCSCEPSVLWTNSDMNVFLCVWGGGWVRFI
jgi:hypothetical protein